MPAVSERQRRYLGMELAKKRKGKKTHTGMSESQLRDFAKKQHGKKHPKSGARSATYMHT